jgi:hypothetical protein
VGLIDAEASRRNSCEQIEVRPTTSQSTVQRTNLSTSQSAVRHSGGVITVLLRYDHHVDHTFLEATHYRDDDSVLRVYADDQEIARFPAGSWDGVYRHGSTWVREKDGRQRTAQRLEARLTVAD